MLSLNPHSIPLPEQADWNHLRIPSTPSAMCQAAVSNLRWPVCGLLQQRRLPGDVAVVSRLRSVHDMGRTLCPCLHWSFIHSIGVEQEQGTRFE